MEITDDVLKKLVHAEAAFREGMFCDEQDMSCSWKDMVDGGWITIETFTPPKGHSSRPELTPKGQVQLANTLASRKVKALVSLGWLDVNCTPSNEIMKLCIEYMMQLTQEELPEFLSSSNSFVREWATTCFDILHILEVCK